MTAIIAEMIMTGRLAPYILAARRNNDGEGTWVQLLIFLVMIVFFVISNIAKSRSQQKQEQEEPVFQLPRRRPLRQPKPPAGAKKSFSHKKPAPLPAEVPVAQPVEQFPEMKLTAGPETAKSDRETLSLELAALEKRDELARGIIYSEILGKPLALREKWGYE